MKMNPKLNQVIEVTVKMTITCIDHDKRLIWVYPTDLMSKYPNQYSELWTKLEPISYELETVNDSDGRVGPDGLCVMTGFKCICSPKQLGHWCCWSIPDSEVQKLDR